MEEKKTYIEKRTIDDIVIITPHSELSSHAMYVSLKDTIDTELQGGYRQFIVDLSKVKDTTNIASECIGLFLYYLKEFKKAENANMVFFVPKDKKEIEDKLRLIEPVIKHSLDEAEEYYSTNNKNYNQKNLFWVIKSVVP